MTTLTVSIVIYVAAVLWAGINRKTSIWISSPTSRVEIRHPLSRMLFVLVLWPILGFVLLVLGVIGMIMTMPIKALFW